MPQASDDSRLPLDAHVGAYLLGAVAIACLGRLLLLATGFMLPRTPRGADDAPCGGDVAEGRRSLAVAGTVTSAVLAR